MAISKSVYAFSKTFGGSVILAAAIVAAVLAGPAKADVVLGNLGATGAVPLGGFSFNLAGNDFAVGFTTGTDPALLDLESVTVGLSADGTSTTGLAQLYSDNAGVPGTLVGTIASGVTVPTSATKVTFTASSPIAMTASTPYWVVFDTAAAVNWFDPITAPVAHNSSGYSAAANAKQFDGLSWINSPLIGSTSITAVPEPGTLVLIATTVAAIGGGLMRRRMRNS